MEKEEILKKIDKEILYQEKLLSFYKTEETHPEDIITYTKLIDYRNNLREQLKQKPKFVSGLYSDNLLLSYFEYFFDKTIDYLFDTPVL